MTIEKAIENLLLERNAEKIEYTTQKSIDEHKECCDLAIVALEKQIPKKPKNNNVNCYHCPNGCKVYKKSFRKDLYCPRCGQAILWESD